MDEPNSGDWELSSSQSIITRQQIGCDPADRRYLALLSYLVMHIPYIRDLDLLHKAFYMLMIG